VVRIYLWVRACCRYVFRRHMLVCLFHASRILCFWHIGIRLLWVYNKTLNTRTKCTTQWGFEQALDDSNPFKAGKAGVTKQVYFFKFLKMCLPIRP